MSRLLLPAAGAAYVTSLVVLAAAVFGVTFVRSGIPGGGDENIVARLTHGDGLWYRSIAQQGYQPSRGPFSDAAFFPVYPLSARALKWVMPVRVEVALLIVANLFFIGALLVTGAYLARRNPTGASISTNYALLAMGLMPATFFLRMGYSESTFLFLVALALYGIERRWRPLALALLVGLATAARPVGVALLLPLALYAWRHLRPAEATQPPLTHDAGDDLRTRRLKATAWRVTRVLCCVLVGSWALIAFSAFLWIEFGDPVAFARAQASCRLTLAPDISLGRKMLTMAILEPIWSVYMLSRPEYWANYERHCNPLFSLQFANPIYFVGTFVLVVIGWRKKWLNDYEILLSAGLLLIPYVTRSYDSAMASFGRFSIVVLPAFFVIGRLLSRLPGPVAAAILCVSTFLLCIYSALFAAGYRLL